MQQITKKRLLIFGVFTIIFLVVCAAVYAQTGQSNALVACMFTPALSVVLTRIVTQEGAHNLYLVPHLRGNIRFYLLAWFGTPLLAYAGAAVYFLVFPAQFDPLGSVYARDQGVQTMAAYAGNLAVMIPLAVLVNPWVGLLSCLGEEFAWRACLLPKLREGFAPAPAVVLTGAIWGLWHAPFIAMGYNYGAEHPLFGIAAMVIFCVVLGCIEGALFFQVQSVWPVALLHASLNALDLAAPSDLFMSQPSNPFLGPDPIGILGGAGLIAAGIYCLYRLVRAGHSEQP